jgi:hypothetical protein
MRNGKTESVRLYACSISETTKWISIKFNTDVHRTLSDAFIQFWFASIQVNRHIT